MPSRGLRALGLAAAATVAVPAAAFMNMPGPCASRSARSSRGSAACGLQMQGAGEPRLWLPGARQDFSDEVSVGRVAWMCCGVYSWME
jgi:hypothetical protein